MTRIGYTGSLLVALTASVTIVAAQQAAPPDPAKDSPEVRSMIQQLRTKVGPRWEDAVHFWCEAPRANRPDDPVIAPTKIFDNVYALGNSGTTVYVIKTSAGLLMIDALGGGTAEATTAQVESQLLPGFQKLGLNPADVKMILVTHGHADHFGGSSYFQQRFGSKVLVSAADWSAMENPPAARGGRGPAGTPTAIPKHDGDIRDGEEIVLGDLQVTPVAVPGHTPGSMAFIFPVKDRNRTHVAAVFGGAWLTPQILSNAALETYLSSVVKFGAATQHAKVDVLLQNHMLMDPIQPKLDRLATRKSADPNPFVVGQQEYQKFVNVMEGCTRVNLTRRRS